MTTDTAWLDRVEAEIDATMASGSATRRADVGSRLAKALRSDPSPRAVKLRACALTCLLGIPAGGPLNIPTCAKHPRT